MWFRRAIYWLNGVPVERALTELRETIRLVEECRQESERLREELAREVARLKQLNSVELPRIKLWESGAANGLQVVQKKGGPVLEPTIDDPLQQWLWQRAWNGCTETGHWDLLNAVAGIARAIREEGMPLSPSLKATAVRYRGGSE